MSEKNRKFSVNRILLTLIPVKKGERDAPGLLSGNPGVANKNETLPGPSEMSSRAIPAEGLGLRVNIGERLSKTANRKLTVCHQNGRRQPGDDSG